jgi:hypothetical protein
MSTSSSCTDTITDNNQDNNRLFAKTDLPEYVTTKSIEGLIVGDDRSQFTPPALNLCASTVIIPPGPSFTTTSVPESAQCDIQPFKQLSLNSRNQWRTQSLTAHHPGIQPGRFRDLFTLYYTDDVDIALLWEAPPLASANASASNASLNRQPHQPSPRIGHHYIIGINLGLQAPLQLQLHFGKNANNLPAPNTRSLYAATIRERKMLIESLLKQRQKDVSPVRLLMGCEKSVWEWDFATPKKGVTGG